MGNQPTGRKTHLFVRKTTRPKMEYMDFIIIILPFSLFFFFTLPRPLSLSCAACFLPAILRLSSTPRWWSKRLGWTNHRAFMALAPSAPPLRSSASPPPRTAPSRRTPPSRGTRHSQQSCTSGPRRCTAAAVRSSWAPAG